MSYETFIGRRYLRAKQKQAFISLITILSVAGVAVGVMALIVVIAVMTGFEADLKSRILGGQPQVMIMRHGGAFTNYRQVLQEVEKTPGVHRRRLFTLRSCCAPKMVLPELYCAESIPTLPAGS